MTKKEIIRLRGNKCEECGLEAVWNGKPLTMQLHDHNKETAKLLCPNCHSQTDTYCGRATWKNEKARIEFIERRRQRMKENNPMHREELRQKLSRIFSDGSRKGDKNPMSRVNRERRKNESKIKS
jgi:hypothetical protein